MLLADARASAVATTGVREAARSLPSSPHPVRTTAPKATQVKQVKQVAAEPPGTTSCASAASPVMAYSRPMSGPTLPA